MTEDEFHKKLFEFISEKGYKSSFYCFRCDDKNDADIEKIITDFKNNGYEVFPNQSQVDEECKIHVRKKI